MFILKQKPEDFIVRENMYFVPQKNGKYAYFLLTKKNWDTLKAIDKIADILKVNRKNFSFSGLKDKNSVSSQYICCNSSYKPKLAKLKIKDIKLKFIGYSDKQLNIGSNKSNSFKIVVRKLRDPLSPVKFVCNYYDDQRFGFMRPINHLIGKELLKGNLEKAIKLYLASPCKNETEEHKDFRKKLEQRWGEFDVFIPGYLENEVRVVRFLRRNPDDFAGALNTIPGRIKRLFVNAFQAYIFNKTLDAYIRKTYSKSDTFTINYSLRKLACIDTPIEAQIPLPGFDLGKYDTCSCYSIVKKLLKEEGIKTSMFGKVKASIRYACFGIANLKISKPTGDDLNKGYIKQTVQFTIPSGSFATIVIKSLACKK